MTYGVVDFQSLVQGWHAVSDLSQKFRYVLRRAKSKLKSRQKQHPTQGNELLTVQYQANT